MPITAILGEQRGDEGKGRFTDMLTPEHDIVARFGGGPNAGHTVLFGDTELALHQVPSGISHEDVKNVIGNGALLDVVKLVTEIEDIESKDIEVTPNNLLISSAAHLILPSHISADEVREASKGKQGSTKSGIAQVAADKYSRLGLRAEALNNHFENLEDQVYDGLIREEDSRRNKPGLKHIDVIEEAEKFIASAKKIRPFVTDTSLFLNRELNNNANVLAEGAQAFLLDPDQGMYPYVTSSSTTVGGIMTGLGVPPNHIDRVIGVSKAVQSHVGGGPFITEVKNEELLERLHGDLDKVDAEKGTTTGRKRKLGYLDLPGIRRAQMINGTTEMALTKLDWFSRFGDDAQVCVAYERKGKILDVAPDAAYKLEQSTPQYEPVEVWDGDISHVRQFDDLPDEARSLIKFIESQLRTHISLLGVGPDREQVIVR